MKITALLCLVFASAPAAQQTQGQLTNERIGGMLLAGVSQVTPPTDQTATERPKQVSLLPAAIPSFSLPAGWLRKDFGDYAELLPGNGQDFSIGIYRTMATNSDVSSVLDLMLAASLKSEGGTIVQQGQDALMKTSAGYYVASKRVIVSSGGAESHRLVAVIGSGQKFVFVLCAGTSENAVTMHAPDIRYVVDSLRVEPAIAVPPVVPPKPSGFLLSTFEVKDRQGLPIVSISDVKMTKYSGMAEFQCVVRNISGQDLKSLVLQVTAHKTDGSNLGFEVNVCDGSHWAEAESKNSVGGCNYQQSLFARDSVQAARNPFLAPDDFTNELEVSIPAYGGTVTIGKMAVTDASVAQRLAAEAQAKKEAYEAARQKRKEAYEAARRKTKEAELNAQLAKYRAEEEAKAAEKQRKLRAACAMIYQNTSDKKLKDLTVKEEQQVRACQALGLYPPE